MNLPPVLTDYAQALTQYYRSRFPALAPLAAPCFLSTAQTTMQPLAAGGVFVITGDIPAMWLRDSAAQVRNYLPFARQDRQVRRLLEGVIATQARSVNIDAYANAFNAQANGHGFQDRTHRSPWVWERKYEVDSLCAPILLARDYMAASGFDSVLTQDFHRMLARVAQVFQWEQRHGSSPYFFERFDCPASDTLPNGGRGAPVGYTGMTWSGFRPSDDACQYGYLIPANMMGAVAMDAAAAMARDHYGDDGLADQCQTLAEDFRQGIRTYGIVRHPRYGDIYCYETDGLGHTLLMDDANAPSLLAAPFVGYCTREDPLYQRTRAFVLSPDNPYYHRGRFAQGVGSPHTPPGYVWHIGIIMQALTSDARQEVLDCLDMLARTHDHTCQMHESLDPDDPARYTRPWFAWANTLLASLLIRLMDEGFFEAGKGGNSGS